MRKLSYAFWWSRVVAGAVRGHCRLMLRGGWIKTLAIPISATALIIFAFRYVRLIHDEA